MLPSVPGRDRRVCSGSAIAYCGALRLRPSFSRIPIAWLPTEILHEVEKRDEDIVRRRKRDRGARGQGDHYDGARIADTEGQLDGHGSDTKVHLTGILVGPYHTVDDASFEYYLADLDDPKTWLSTATCRSARLPTVGDCEISPGSCRQAKFCWPRSP
jgi:hypothetical protein